MMQHTSSKARSQRGAATLVVVMMLFLVMALLAAYANRSLLFEQRVSNSYFRASVSQEAAEAGVEWTIAMLNGTAIDGSCTPVATGGQRFADRYLGFGPSERSIQPIIKTSKMVADCTRIPTGWTCRCPLPDMHVTAAAMDDSNPHPSFGVKVDPEPAGRPASLQITSQGCTFSVPDSCLDPKNNSTNLQATSQFKAAVTLVSAVRTPPAAPLVVKGKMTSTGVGLGLHNTDPRSAGLLFITGDTAPTGLVDARLESVPGTAPSLARVIGDDKLKNAATLPADVFRMFMGANPARYKQHPALRVVACNGDCATTLEDAYNAGKRIVWIDGPLSIGSNKVLGTAADPMIVIADGDVTLAGPFQLTGMLVTTGKLTWNNTTGLPSLIIGTVVVGGDMQTGGAMDILYQQAIMDQLRNRMGSYVRVAGGWIDSD